MKPWIGVLMWMWVWPGGLIGAEAYRVGPYGQEVRTEYGGRSGLPAERVTALAVGAEGAVYAGTDGGVARFEDGRWVALAGVPAEPVEALGTSAGRVMWVARGTLWEWSGAGVKRRARLPEGRRATSLALGARTVVGTEAGVFELEGGRMVEVASLRALLGEGSGVRQVAQGGTLVVGARAGLFEEVSRGRWVRLFPSDDQGRSWAPVDVGGVTWDSRGRLWFGSPQGVGCRGLNGAWRLFTGAEGLPWNEITAASGGEEGVVWFGTTRGALRYDGVEWAYRQGRRWVPADRVLSVASGPGGEVWLGTDAGISRIERRRMTLAEKANFYERQIDAVHRRTPWEYVLEVSVPEAGTTNGFQRQDSDNDGLWTAMYGAGECFAYGATKSPVARSRAKRAFEALRWLGEVTQGGVPAPPKGYVARTILPTDGPDPNVGRLEADERMRATRDALWKVYEPRWPKSADGKWYWKSDTSSDELDGHYFFYPLYYDLVAETAEERARVREHMQALTDHLVTHGFRLVDHDGKPTRWGVFDPENLNGNPMWADERGLNSLSLLSYLSATAHVTGDPKYHDLVDRLCREHHYDTNLRVPKIQRGVGSVNHSDDEMAFMCFYNLLKYARDERLKEQAAYACFGYGLMELPERNPFFNFTVAVSVHGRTFTNPWGTHALKLWDGWLEDAVDTLRRFPLDRYDWAHRNAHRLDVVRLPRQVADPYETRPLEWGTRRDGKVLPVDERYFEHWNHNPFELNTGGEGRTLATGAVFLLPYYMGLYHGVLVDEGRALLEGTPR